MSSCELLRALVSSTVYALILKSRRAVSLFVARPSEGKLDNKETQRTTSNLETACFDATKRTEDLGLRKRRVTETCSLIPFVSRNTTGENLKLPRWPLSGAVLASPVPYQVSTVCIILSPLANVYLKMWWKGLHEARSMWKNWMIKPSKLRYLLSVSESL